MAVDRVKFQEIVSSQVPDYVRDDFPLLIEFLEEYYKSQEFQGGSIDIAENIDKYVKVGDIYNVITETRLSAAIDSSDTTISLDSNTNFTDGFPEKNGLIQINSEIIKYDYKTERTFEGCTRGFSGITTYVGSNTPDQLVFEETVAADHKKGATVYNLNVRFLQEFFKKIKNQYTNGFSDRTLADDINQRNFVFGANSFYKAKGTDQGFKILFKTLYGVDVDIIKPSEYLLKPSDADYRVTQDYVVEDYIGDPMNLKNLTIFQDSMNARGTVTDVELIRSVGDNKFYQISIDYGYRRDIDVFGTIRGSFKATPKTQLINNVAVGKTVIDVDSTVGFAKSGFLSIFNADGDEDLLYYTDKTLTQFIGLTTTTTILEDGADVRYDEYVYGYVGVGTANEIRAKITSTLKEFKLLEEERLFNKGDKINVQTLGLISKQKKANIWKENIKTNWNVKKIEVVDLTQIKYKVNTFDEVFFYPGNVVTFTSSNGVVREGEISNVTTPNEFIVVLDNIILPADLDKKYTVENKVLKGKSSRYPLLEKFNANVLNTYEKTNGQFLVASNSIANFDNKLNTNAFDKITTFSGKANGDELTIIDTSPQTIYKDHGYYTGDVVYLESNVSTASTTVGNLPFFTTTESKFSNVDNGVYFVKRLNATTIKLALSQADLYANRFISPAGTVTDNKLYYFKHYEKELIPQKIYREIGTPSTKSGDFPTPAGYTGIFNNGVELLNYKSDDSVTYGGIREFRVTDGGFGYDVINPPLLKVDDILGVGATGVCAVNGSLQEIRVIDQGYDYLDQPIIEITGGNGSGATAKVNLASVSNEVIFNADPGPASGVNLGQDRIGFTSFHKFRQNEKIVYVTGGVKAVAGLSTNESYFCNIINNSVITLHVNTQDSEAGINTIGLSGYGVGKQAFRSAKQKKIVSNILVTNSGKGYQNKERRINAVGVNTSSNVFTIGNHGYESGECIKYAVDSTSIQGLSSSKEYYVRKKSDDQFMLAEVGTGITSKKYFYDNNIFVDVKSPGDGTFNYKPISVSIKGTIGVNTSTGQDFNAVIEPIFRGEIDSIDLRDPGVGYGSSEILNFKRQPAIRFAAGSGAQLTPIISNGRILEVVVNTGGKNYNSPPNMVLSGIGSFAKLTPILKDGSITEVKVISGGIGYQNDTRLIVTPAGLDCKVQADIDNWTVNLYEKGKDNIKDDDGFVESDISNQSLQYSYLYAPRRLRETTFSTSNDGKVDYGTTDLLKVGDTETVSTNHSPIIGWAYDGNPIYGPYGYNKQSGGPVKKLKSGYELRTQQVNRPPLSVYPAGFFVEDYVYTGTGDLDQFNGRFAVTPDFPLGVYAYYTTFNEVTASTGPFNRYNEPVFPYVIGNAYKSEPIDFNFKKISNHIDYDIEANQWLRNTKSYNMTKGSSGYKYIFNPNDTKPSIIDITAVSSGSVETIGVTTGGFDYRVGDKVNFDNDGTSGSGANARVERIEGKTISTVSVASTQIDGVEFIPHVNQSKFIGISSEPHNYKKDDIVVISGLSRHFDGFDGQYKVGIDSGYFKLGADGISDVSTTGIITFIPLIGRLQYPFIQNNDILDITGEKVKVLKIDHFNDRVLVQRTMFGTSGPSKVGLTQVFQDPRKFSINVGTLRTTQTLQFNKEIYFNPVETLGIGTVGAGTTLRFSNPGAAATSSLNVPDRVIYYPFHGFNLNDPVKYSTGGGNPIVVWTGQSGVGTLPLDAVGVNTLYAVPVSNRFIGLSTTKVGLTTLGYQGVNGGSGLMYFTNIGTGVNHSLETDLDNVLKARVEQHVVTVSTGSTHGLSQNDKIEFAINPKNQIDVIVKYDDFNRRIVFDPKTFTANDVDVNNNAIIFNNRPFKTGDKVIFTGTTGGLINEGMYYVYNYSPESIKLVTHKSELNQINPKFVQITSKSGGTLSKVNPLVNASRNNKVKFDLSDESLSFLSNGVRYPAFKLELFTDPGYESQFVSTGLSDAFEVTSSGEIGIDATAHLSVTISDSVPSILYYLFKRVNIDFLLDVKSEIFVDQDVASFNQIEVVATEYDGIHDVSTIQSTSFTYNLPRRPVTSSYNTSSSTPTYNTNSKTAYGAINKVQVISGGYGYRELPGISSTTSGIGTEALLYADSTNIGKILEQRFSSKNIGYDYPSDNTIRAVANLPEILEIAPLNEFESIGINSVGRNYLVPPDLIVQDGLTGNVITDAQLEYKLTDKKVDIVRNATGLFNVTPRIIAINNSNGVGILSALYTEGTKVVRLFLDTTFSDAETFPYKVGEKVMVEGINIGQIGVDTTGSGYNSADYNYDYFNVVGVNTALGGTGAYVDYSLANSLGSNKFPGEIIRGLNGKVNGRVIPASHLPFFTAILTVKDFFLNEKLDNFKGATGEVQSWNNKTKILKVSSKSEYQIGDNVRGETSLAEGIIIKKYDFKSEIEVGAGATIVRGWTRNTGFLNDDLQRLPNNEYYQNFSYSLKSIIPNQTWDESVGALNHTSGFGRFGDLQIISTPDNTTSLIPVADESNIETVVEITSEKSMVCFDDFDEVTENDFQTNGRTLSNEILFENRILSDYFQSIGNRVLDIDDFSSQFESNERSEAFTAIESYKDNYVFNKIFSFARDKNFTDERQLTQISIIKRPNTVGFVNEFVYETFPVLGFYDTIDTPDGWNLTFNPVKFAVNNYDVSTFSFNIFDDVTTTDAKSYGTVASVFSSQTGISGPANQRHDIVTTNASNRALKVFALFEEVNTQDFYGIEISAIHDGSEVYMDEFGAITNTSEATPYGAGIGTYGGRLQGGNLVIEFYPNVAAAITCNAVSVAMAGAGIGTGSEELSVHRQGSNYKSISASGSPTAHVIGSYTAPFYGGYYIVSVENTTDSEYELSEVLAINSDRNEVISQFGMINTEDPPFGYTGIGTVGITSTGTGRNIVYTPPANKDVKVRTFYMEGKVFDDNSFTSVVDLKNGRIQSNRGVYTGTKNSVRTSFELSHRGNPIFQREINPADTSVVDVQNNIITLTNHFFNTGEELFYSATDSDDTPIAITSTVVPGIGATTFLPPTVFAVKLDDQRIRLAKSAEDALNEIPVTFNFQSVGVGNSHFFISTKQNAKALIAIDNMVQSPVSPTPVTTTLASPLAFDFEVNLAGITSIFADDLLQIDNEIVQVQQRKSGNVIEVQRAYMGTQIATHTAGTTVTKLSGNYNITKNTLNFASAPYGNIPLSSTTSPPDERDFLGITTSSTFQGRTFMKRAAIGSTLETYTTNVVFDDISHQFTGIRSDFILKHNGNNISGITSDTFIMVNGIVQKPTGLLVGDYQVNEDIIAGVSTLKFMGRRDGAIISDPQGYDYNRGGLPVGGIIESVGSEPGANYQPLIGAGGTAIVSIAGTIQSIAIGNTGSGYRSGAQDVNVGVRTYGGIEFIGTATISGGNIVSIAVTNPGAGYTSTNPPTVEIDEPLPYFNMPLSYATGSPVGTGRLATVDVTVGMAGSITNFEIRDPGYGYGNTESLTVSTGGALGIPLSGPLTEFKLNVDKVFNDRFGGFSVGELQMLDDISIQFDGVRTAFNLTFDGLPISIQAGRESQVDVEKTLIVFVNDILQEPGKSYTFNGGSLIRFKEAPKAGFAEYANSRDKVVILFYKGAGDIDVVFTDILETIKRGDTLNIDNNPGLGQPITYDEEMRVVSGINTVDVVNTNNYPGPGILTDKSILRPVSWCKQQNDRIIDGQYVAKDRVEQEPEIYPAAYLINPVSVATSQVYVHNLRPLFDSNNEAPITSFQNNIVINTQKVVVNPKVTATVSAGGSVTALNIVNAGVGYTVGDVAEVSIGEPSTGTRATATVTLSNGKIGNVNITENGSGYSQSNPPQVLVTEPKFYDELITNVTSYTGDHGTIVGFGTTTVGNTPQVILDLFIEKDSFIRLNKYVGTGYTVSKLDVNDYFTVFNSTVGVGTEGVVLQGDNDGNVYGQTTSNIDAVFQVNSAETLETTVLGIGLTTIRRVFCNIAGLGTINFASTLQTFDSTVFSMDNLNVEIYQGGIAADKQFGRFSWGRIDVGVRPFANSFDSYRMNGYAGISTSGLVTRHIPLRFQSYTV